MIYTFRRTYSALIKYSQTDTAAAAGINPGVTNQDAVKPASQEALAIYDRCIFDADQNDLLCARLFRDILAANNPTVLLNDLDTFQALLCAVCNPDHWPLIPQSGAIDSITNHTLRVTQLALSLARQMGLPASELKWIYRGSLLHDIGKLTIPEEIMLKPGELTDLERAIIQQHPQRAYDLIQAIPELRPALDIPYCHHEKWDGSGYPRGLAGEDIPLSARIFAVVDVWDALTNDRPYRLAWSKQRALAEIQQESGRYFDPQVVTAFSSMINSNGMEK